MIATAINPLRTWLENLTISQHREAVNKIITRFEINRTTLYLWKQDNKKFTTIEREELNKISQVINNTNIFESWKHKYSQRFMYNQKAERYT